MFDDLMPSSRVPHPTTRFLHLASSDHASRTSRSDEVTKPSVAVAVVVAAHSVLNPRSGRIPGRPGSWSRDFLPCRVFVSWRLCPFPPLRLRRRKGPRAPAARAGPRSSRMTRPAPVPVARCKMPYGTGAHPAIFQYPNPTQFEGRTHRGPWLLIHERTNARTRGTHRVPGDSSAPERGCGCGCAPGSVGRSLAPTRRATLNAGYPAGI